MLYCVVTIAIMCKIMLISQGFAKRLLNTFQGCIVSLYFTITFEAYKGVLRYIILCYSKLWLHVVYRCVMSGLQCLLLLPLKYWVTFSCMKAISLIILHETT